MQVLKDLDEARIARLCAEDEWFWLDLHTTPENHVEQVTRMGELFDIRDLTLKDTIDFHQRPKAFDDREYVLLVFFGVNWIDDGHLDERHVLPVEVHVYISGHWLITVRRDTFPYLAKTRQALRENTERTNEEEIVYSILHGLVSSFLPVLAAIEHSVDDLEARIERSILGMPGTGVGSGDVQRQFFNLRRLLVSLQRVLGPESHLFPKAGEEILALPGLEEDPRHDYFRDVQDDLAGLIERVHLARQTIGEALQIHSSAMDNRLGESNERLSMVATVFLPLGVVVGFFGMNFAWMVRNVTSATDFLIFGIGSMIVATMIVLGIFWRSGLLGRRRAAARLRRASQAEEQRYEDTHSTIVP